jgi:hypothetical protein
MHAVRAGVASAVDAAPIGDASGRSEGLSERSAVTQLHFFGVLRGPYQRPRVRCAQFLGSQMRYARYSLGRFPVQRLKAR